MKVTFSIPMPKSWSDKKKREMRYMPHKQTPDVDNLIKGLMDTLPEDSHIWNIHIEKVWDITGSIRVEQL